MIHRYKMLVGLFVGDILEGEQIGGWDSSEAIHYHKYLTEELELARDSPQVKANTDAHLNWNLGEGVWITKLNQRFVDGKEVEDLRIPFDRYGREIFVGDTIAYAMRDLTVAQMKITKFAVKRRECIMYGVDIDSHKSTRNHAPSRCIKLN